jgi:succinate-acetate transporter protein
MDKKVKPFLCRVANGIRLFFDFIFSFVDSLFNEHQLIRRTIVIWSLLIITWCVYIIIPKLEQGHSVTALGMVIGVFSSVTAFYIYLRDKDGD